MPRARAARGEGGSADSPPDRVNRRAKEVEAERTVSEGRQKRRGPGKMTTMLHTGRLPAREGCLAVLFAIGCGAGAALWAKWVPRTSPLTRQSMIRADIRDTAPTVVPVIKGLLKGDVIFTNLESA